VRLIGFDGAQLGVKPIKEALKIAKDLDLDLVEVASQGVPPVCRIMDYGKFKFDTGVKVRESRKKSTSNAVKEMKYRTLIGTGDFETKTKQVVKFIAQGHKVKLTVMFRGREVYHPELGRKILDRVAEATEDIAKIELNPKLEGRNMTMVLAPYKKPQSNKKSIANGIASKDLTSTVETTEASL
jgi:translation initiation factor IF-3